MRPHRPARTSRNSEVRSRGDNSPIGEDFLQFAEKVLELLNKSLGDGFNFCGFEEGIIKLQKAGFGQADNISRLGDIIKLYELGCHLPEIYCRLL